MSIFERIIKRFFYKLYAALHLSTTYKNYRQFKDSIFVVYSPGKTGSSTIYYTLLKYLPFNHVYHVHFLSDEWIEKRIPGERKNKNDRNIVLAKKVYKALSKRDWKNVYYITCARDPYSRGISAYFHNHKKIEIERKSIENLRKEIQKYVTEISLNWFRSDYSNYTRIPFENINFDSQKGFIIMNKNISSYLILRTDKISSCFQDSFKQMTCFKIPKLEQVNKRSNTGIASIYNELKNYYFEDQENLEKKINSEFVVKFFSAEERKKLYEKYRKIS